MLLVDIFDIISVGALWIRLIERLKERSSDSYVCVVV